MNSTVSERRFPAVRPTVILNGAHRGGEAATAVLLENVLPSPADVFIVDQTAGRSQELSRRWAGAGHAAVPVTSNALAVHPNPIADLEGICTDDAAVQARLLRRSNASFAFAGLIVMAPVTPDGGGYVLGFGACVHGSDDAHRQDALSLFERLAALAPSRTSSELLRGALVNEAQMAPVRQMLYAELGRRAHQFLSTGQTQSGLCVASPWPEPGVYDLALQPREGHTRMEMSRRASRLPDRHAFAFYDNANVGWLYMVFKAEGRPNVAVELPTPSLPKIAAPAPAPVRVYIGD